MVGGLYQTVELGVQDLYLSPYPVNSFFKQTYKRHPEFNNIYFSYKMENYGRTYANFKIHIDVEYDIFDTFENCEPNTDMIYPISLNLRNLNKESLFQKCIPVKKKKEKREKISRTNVTPPMFSYSNRIHIAANRKQQRQNQRQIKAQINIKVK